jgi:hypothetical protein
MLKRFSIFIFVFLAAISLFASHSDEFVLGNYSYLKSYNSVSYSRFYRNIARKMQEAHYNMTIWESNALNEADTTIVRKQFLHDLGIDSYLSDHYMQINDDNEVVSASLENLSYANHWVFEAEYDRRSKLHENETSAFYMFNIKRSGKLKQIGEDAYTWLCDPKRDKKGVIIDNLRYRWPNQNSPSKQHKHKGDFDIIGSEYEFPYMNGKENYVRANGIYVTFRYKLNSPIDDQHAITIGVKLLETDNKKNSPKWNFVNMTNSTSGEESSSFTLTASDLTSDATSKVDSTGFRTITLELDLMDITDVPLPERGYLYRAGWDCRLRGITPYVEWSGKHEIEFDNIIIEDKIFRLVKSGGENLNRVITSRLDNYNNTDIKVKKFYTVDEPTFSQYKSFTLLKEFLSNPPENSILRKNKIEIVTTHFLLNYHKEKPNGKRLLDAEFFFNETKPEELMVDYYPLKSNAVWNDESDEDNFIQNHIDWYATANYRRAKLLAKDIPFYVVPCTAGNEWSPDIWTGYQYPTVNMIKCLQYLPLCYGVDGIIDYKFMTKSSPNHKGRQWWSLINYEKYNKLNETAQFKALKKANKKVLHYGKELKKWDWIDATYINYSGVQQFDNFSYYPDETLNPEVEYYFPREAISTYSDMTETSYPEPYEGYVHIGFFKNTEKHQSYMLVNRRTDYITNGDKTLKEIRPNIIMSDYSKQDAIMQANKQYVCFDLENANPTLKRDFGNDVALFDSYTNIMYEANSHGKIFIPIEAGEAVMLQLRSISPIK